MQGFVFALEVEEVLANRDNGDAIKTAMVLRNQAVSAWLQAAVDVRSEKHRGQAWRNTVGLLRAMGDSERANEVESASA